MKNNYIKPNGLKGNEAVDRMKSLMGIKPMVESTIDRLDVSLTKIGPDGKRYAIVKENSEYYIKVTEKTSNLVAEDFQYMGGLQNKKEKVYPSYAKAQKQLNLMFISLSESLGQTNLINAFRNDNLIKENEEEMIDEVEETDVEETVDEGEAACGIVRGAGHDTHIMEDEAELSEAEKAIDDMITGKEYIKEDVLQNNRLKISTALDIVNESENKAEQFKALYESLTVREKAALIESLKKKA